MLWGRSQHMLGNLEIYNRKHIYMENLLGQDIIFFWVEKRLNQLSGVDFFLPTWPNQKIIKVKLTLEHEV